MHVGLRGTAFHGFSRWDHILYEKSLHQLQFLRTASWVCGCLIPIHRRRRRSIMATSKVPWMCCWQLCISTISNSSLFFPNYTHPGCCCALQQVSRVWYFPTCPIQYHLIQRLCDIINITDSSRWGRLHATSSRTSQSIWLHLCEVLLLQQTWNSNESKKNANFSIRKFLHKIRRLSILLSSFTITSLESEVKDLLRVSLSIRSICQAWGW